MMKNDEFLLIMRAQFYVNLVAVLSFSTSNKKMIY